ncbi:MAG: diguanylate cyclase [Lachnospiraceae bacterium]|nr:diguanylate cyclase [Lachnospiraceae bacterium]
MDIKMAAKLQEKNILLHRLVFLTFVMQRIALQLIYKNTNIKNTIIMVAFALVCVVIEEVLRAFRCFGSLIALRVLRFVQCTLVFVMLIFTETSNDSNTAIIAFLLVFVIDLFLTLDVTDKLMPIGFIIGLGVIISIVLFVRMTIIHDNKWIYMFFAALLIGFVLICGTNVLSDFVKQKDNELLDERRKFENIVEKNENILNMQNKLRNTNDQLNIQKIDLERANKQIKEANDEMKVQEDIMRQLSSSFDVKKISSHITEAIIDVKKLSFCAVYIKKNVYHNKHANYAIQTKISNLENKIKEQMEDLYVQLTSNGEVEKIIHDELWDEIPYLRNANINSVYIKVLGSEDDSYGLFMIGDSRRNLFDSNMSFYNTIIAQFDIAINNARLYNDMLNMARKDGLTGINNRIYFNELFNETTYKIALENSCMSVALFDIDKFKNVNDTYGHLAGDEVIKRIATVTEDFIDQYDGFVCRYGGEEFVAALPHKNLEEASPIINELFEKLCSQVVSYNEFDIHLSVSVGVTAFPEVCKDTTELLKRADWCMYYAKEHGRHQVKIDDGSIEKEYNNA